MRLNRTPIAAALCCMALASSPLVFARGDTSDAASMHRSGSASSMSGSHYGSSMDRQTVRQVQQALSDKGHNPGPIDGIMGPRTRAALEQYQRQNDLAGASGLDQQTLDSLGVQASAATSRSGHMASGSRDSGSSAGSGAAATGGSGGSPYPSSSSSADQGTASDGAANSRFPTPESRASGTAGSTDSTSGKSRAGSSARSMDSTSRGAGSSAGGAGSTLGGAGGSDPYPSSSSSADQGTASDGAANSRYPTPESRGGSSAGSTGGGTGGSR